MQCNIDARGKAYRYRLGIYTLSIAALFSLLTLVGVFTSPNWWYVVAMIAFAGAFTIFEARAGWCVIRAMGFKTRI